jgi:hypothetical protein
MPAGSCGIDEKKLVKLILYMPVAPMGLLIITSSLGLVKVVGVLLAIKELDTVVVNTAGSSFCPSKVMVLEVTSPDKLKFVALANLLAD